ncbi:unnamed protein product [Linum tenue]|uniref:Uncharacterized protein n=1 Tax=Linum tenue TaxID=586396 RepID=A0AAV0MD93_9ROSI|nr:unnamed protein product [Linum tenue]
MMQRRSPPKHRHDGTSPLPLGMDWSPPPRKLVMLVPRVDETRFGHMILEQGGVTVSLFLHGLSLRSPEIQIL